MMKYFTIKTQTLCILKSTSDGNIKKVEIYFLAEHATMLSHTYANIVKISKKKVFLL